MKFEFFINVMVWCRENVVNIMFGKVLIYGLM